MYTIANVIQAFNHSVAHTIQLHIYMAQFPLFSLQLLIPPLPPFVSLSTYLAPSSYDRNRPPQSQVACKLTPFAPPFTQLSHPSQIPKPQPFSAKQRRPREYSGSCYTEQLSIYGETMSLQRYPAVLSSKS
jgi:hypothetical protein